METHLATNKASTHCGVFNSDNFRNLICGNIAKKISFTFKKAHKGTEVKCMLAFSSWRSKSLAQHICTWPIAKVIPKEPRALPIYTPAKAWEPCWHRHQPEDTKRKHQEWGNSPMEDPSQISKDHL